MVYDGIIDGTSSSRVHGGCHVSHEQLPVLGQRVLASLVDMGLINQGVEQNSPCRVVGTCPRFEPSSDFGCFAAVVTMLSDHLGSREFHGPLHMTNGLTISGVNGGSKPTWYTGRSSANHINKDGCEDQITKSVSEHRSKTEAFLYVLQRPGRIWLSYHSQLINNRQS